MEVSGLVGAKINDWFIGLTKEVMKAESEVIDGVKD